MGSGSTAVIAEESSIKKHSRSRDAEGETDEKSKRRKHKHQRHHRHYHHHRSKKRDEDKSEMEVDGEFPPVVAELKKYDDEDMEEGEIVECHQNLDGGDAVHCPNSADIGKGVLDMGESDSKLKIKGIRNGFTELGDAINGKAVISLSDGSEEKKYKKPGHYRSRSPDEHDSSRRSESYHRVERSGSQSRSDFEDVDTLKAAQRHVGDRNCSLNGKHANSDSEISVGLERLSCRHGNRDRATDQEREPGADYDKLGDRRDRRYEKEASHRDQDARDIDRVRRHEKGRASRKDGDDRGRTMTREKDRRRYEEDQERKLERDGHRQVDRNSEMHTERGRNHGRGREKEMENYRIMDKTLDRDRLRDTESNRSDRERALERDCRKERDQSLERVRDKRREDKDREYKQRDKETVGDRRRDREREQSNDRQREKRREGSDRVWEGGRDKYRDRDRDAEYHLSRHNKNDGGDGKRERQSEFKYDDYSSSRDRRENDHTSKPCSPSRSFRGSEDKNRREEEEQEEYQERISLQLAEEEEDDVFKIQEESRRRRQEILEKYKKMQLKDHVQTKSEEGHQDKELGKQPILQPEESVASAEGADDKLDDSFAVVKSLLGNGDSAGDHTSENGLGAGTPKSERSGDMFCDDIFGESPTGVRKLGKTDGLPIESSGLHDNWDDAEGYYSYRFGELLDGRYEIAAAHGKGVFSSVVRAKDLKEKNGEPVEVAIKIIRNNETMFKAGQSELIILNKLVGADPDDKRHCVRFLSSFKYRNHLCLVFESLSMNLREVLKKFGRNIGLKLTAVRVYAKQLLIALKHLRNCGVLHCDIKPDNMLVNESKNVLKLCDFGNAMFAGKNEITPYLVSRFYRAPEIILGLTYDHPVDIWSVGCCLYELYTGKVLFPGATNNDMLCLHMELKGPFPKKMLRKGSFIERHFDQDMNFLASEEDPVTKKIMRKMIANIKPKDLGSVIMGSAGEDPKILANFKDFLDKIFMLDPDKRMTVSQALAHPFITGK